jgi:hypothetical protein
VLGVGVLSDSNKTRSVLVVSCVKMCVCATDPACPGVKVGAHVAGLERVMRRGALWARRARVLGSRRAVRGVSG